MQQLSDWYFSIVFFAGILGFIVAAILFFVNKTDTFSSRLLAGFLVCISILSLIYGLMTTRFFLRFPYFWRAFVWASFSFAPLGYLYVRSVLQQSFRFRKWDFIFFVPAVLSSLNHIPYFILPTAEKLDFLVKMQQDRKIITDEIEGFLPQRWAVWTRVIIGITAVVGQLLLLKKWKPRILNAGKRVKQNVETFQWLSLFTIVMAIFWLLIMFEFIFHFTWKADLNYTIILTISGTIFFICIYLLLRPSILYGMTGWLQLAENTLTPEEVLMPVEESKAKNTLTVEQGEAYKLALESHFTNNLPFLKNGYTIGDLSHELNIPSHQLSAFINQEYGKNFNELINEYRVDHLAEKIKSSTDHFQYTLEALGKEAGFNSRAAFISAVKKRTGKTPSEFFGRRGETIPQ